LAATLCGCVTDGELGTPPLAVKVSPACERVLAPVALPAISPSDDARAAFVKDDAALIAATGEIATGRRCLVRQRQLYATPGK
jgi:hypothetical protein